MKMSSKVICMLLLVVLAALANSQQTVQLCPNDPLPDPSPFTCTSLLTHSWNGSAFTGQCPDADIIDSIALNVNAASVTCGIFTGAATLNGQDLTSSLSFTPTASLNGSTIQCRDGTEMLVPTSDFIIEITESLQIRSIVDSSLECVTVELEPPADTTGIASYTVVALLGDTEVSQGTSDDASDLEVEVCGLSLCNNNYMFRAVANGGSICDSSETAITSLTLSALNQIANVRLSTDGSGLEWDAPSNADSAGCTIERYTISVNGDAYNSSTTSVSFSVFDPQPDTCDSSLSITVTASVRTLSLVGSSVSDAFNPTSVFPANPGSVTVGSDGVTYASEFIMVQLTPDPAVVDALQPFPDAEFSVSYSSAEPGCGQTVTTLDNVASINYNCLNADLDAFSVTLVDGPDCSSSAINIVPLPSFPLVDDSSFPSTMTVTSNSAVVTLTTANMVAANSFNVVGTAFQTSNDAMVAMDTRTYPENIVFRGLEPSTSYRYTIQIVSTADDSIVIGSYSGTFTTSPPSETDIAPIVGGVVGGIVGLLLLLILVMVYLIYRWKKKEDMLSTGIRTDQQEFRDIDLKDNVAYGPVTPQQPAAMYEEISAPPEKIEMSGNVAYGQISH